MPPTCSSSSPTPTSRCLNAMMHVIVEEGLVDEAFIATARAATRS